MPERHGAAHRIMASKTPGEMPTGQKWKAHTREGLQTMRGPVVSSTEMDEGHWAHDLRVVRETGGYSADVDLAADVSPAGMTREHYVAGPFRTQHRAQIAAESLTGRALSGRAEEYQTGSAFFTPEELRDGG